MKDLKNLEKIISIIFKDKDLLTQSVVHRSYLNEHSNFQLDHNERLEFLGDAVLELIVTEYLYKKYPNPEGELTNWRASLVNSNMLADIAEEIKLNDFLFLSKGEARDKKSKARRYILANAMEALIGAIYLDQGFKKSEKFIHKFIISRLPHILENKLFIDSKSRFQESSQGELGITPVYKVLEEFGPDHSKQFKVGVYLEKELIATGKGSSKQEAQTSAAENALKKKGW